MTHICKNNAFTPCKYSILTLAHISFLYPLPLKTVLVNLVREYIQNVIKANFNHI